MENLRYLLMKPAALLGLLERAASGDAPEDLMFEVLDIASQTHVTLEEDPDQ